MRCYMVVSLNDGGIELIIGKKRYRKRENSSLFHRIIESFPRIAK